MSCLKHVSMTCMSHRLEVLSTPNTVCPHQQTFLMSVILSSVYKIKRGPLPWSITMDLTSDSPIVTNLSRSSMWPVRIFLWMTCPDSFCFPPCTCFLPLSPEKGHVKESVCCIRPLANHATYSNADLSCMAGMCSEFP